MADLVRQVRGSDSKSPLTGCPVPGAQPRLSIGVSGLVHWVSQHRDRAHVLGPWVDWIFRATGHTSSLSRGDAEASLSKW